MADIDAQIQRAADCISHAEALILGAGAGMGVDSGLPDFRGDTGFWNAYPRYQHLGLRFVELANPRWFRDNPALAWGFYGHRLNLYRATRPHAGFALLKRWCARMPHGGRVVTSNIDGQFQRAGFDPNHILEVHGAIDWLQCTRNCGPAFPADDVSITIDDATMEAADPLPSCPRCGALARPNVLMFNDFGWDSSRSDEQQEAFVRWAGTLPRGKVVAIECGAGTAIPSIRYACENAVRTFGGTLIRINPRESDVPPGQISLPLGALAALEAIDARLSESMTAS